MNKDYKNLAHFIYGWKREDVKTQNRMIDWLLLFAYYKAHRQQPIIETVQCDEEIADKVSKLRVLGYGTGCVNTMCAGVSTGVCHAPIVQQVSDNPPLSSLLAQQTMYPKNFQSYSANTQLSGMQTEPCIFFLRPAFFSKLLFRFFFFCGIAKKKKRT